MEKAEANPFFKDLRNLSLFATLAGFFLLSLIYFSPGISFSFLVGALLGYLNLFTLKQDGKKFLQKVYNNVMCCMEKPYQKERTLFLIKVYLRLLALGLIFYFLITWLKLHPVFIIIGFTLVYAQIFLLTLWYTLKRKEIC